MNAVVGKFGYHWIFRQCQQSHSTSLERYTSSRADMMRLLKCIKRA